ncbi:MAG TPA: AgmX/PglI C-terminal domain-containing protein [Kofleriaceae bacterium]|nr:AgmX/PglI C-terminal domain-containing protein [Kofleriaceae bacterium]
MEIPGRRVWLAFACVAVAGCPGSQPATTPAAPAPVANVTTAAGQSIEPARCDDSKARLRPFALNWDATEQAEFAGQTRQSLAVVKVDGCSMELLTQCRLPGEYRVTESAGNLQTLSLDSDDALYLEVPLAVSSLSGHLKRSGKLQLSYYVRGIGYATAPGLYQSQLGPGCEGATHLVINYALGAYELAASSQASADASAKALGAGGGGASNRSASALFRGGDLQRCDGDAMKCDAPVRLRLVPITGGSPPASDAAAAAIATTAPAAAAPDAPPLTREEVQAGFRATYPALQACFVASLGRSETAGRLDTQFRIEPDGTVSTLDLTTTANFDRTFVECARDALHSMRFRPAGNPAEIRYPLIFQVAE